MSETKKFDENWLGHNLTIKFEDSYKKDDGMPITKVVYKCLTCEKTYRRSKPRVSCTGKPIVKVEVTPECCVCGEDFPVVKEPATFSMGKMRKLRKAPKKIRDAYSEWLKVPGRNYLCGNCFFDLTD